MHISKISKNSLYIIIVLMPVLIHLILSFIIKYAKYSILLYNLFATLNDYQLII